MIINIGNGIEVDGQLVEQIKDLAGLDAMRYLAQIIQQKEAESNSDAIVAIRANRDREAFGLTCYAQACQDISEFILNMRNELEDKKEKVEEQVDKVQNKRFL